MRRTTIGIYNIGLIWNIVNTMVNMSLYSPNFAPINTYTIDFFLF